MELPAAFLARMGDLLNEDTPRFLKSLEEEPRRAFRFDPLRLSREDLALFLGDGVKEQVPFAQDAFYFEKDGIGNTLPHIGGGIYVQEPAAMAPVSALEEEEVRAALDLCAAPGGKSLQAAQRLLSQEGFLVCNEPDPQRRKALRQNLERLGEKRACVSGFDAACLPAAFQERFDLVIADVPCSGEGMMRKNESAWKNWNEGNIRALSALQQKILESAAFALAPGGRLLYSTCTWSREENEENIARFLSLHPDFSLIAPREEVSRCGAPGEIPNTLRFYPHLFPGEGQFLAVLRKAGKIPPRKDKPKEKKGKKDEKEEVVADFFRAHLTGPPVGRIAFRGETAYLVPPFPMAPDLFLCPGVPVGCVRKGRLIPHHFFFRAYAPSFRNQFVLEAGDPRVAAYLRGEEIPLSGAGYGVLFCRSLPLGGVKVSGGRGKNLFPKGLRTTLCTTN